VPLLTLTPRGGKIVGHLGAELHRRGHFHLAQLLGRRGLPELRNGRIRALDDLRHELLRRVSDFAFGVLGRRLDFRGRDDTIPVEIE